MLIIPAIDLRGGLCVRLSQGDFQRETVYSDDPIGLAAFFVNEGAEWLHIVDLDGARTGSLVNIDMVARLRQAGITANIEYGGGIRTIESVDSALAASVTRVIVGSILAESERLAKECFQRGEAVVAGIDTRDGRVAVHGWNESTELSGIAFAAQMVDLGCRRIVWTDIATDGMMQGPNLLGLAAMVRSVPVPIVASGGVSSLDDLKAIADTGVEGVIIGRAIYEGKFTVADAVRAVV